MSAGTLKGDRKNAVPGSDLKMHLGDALVRTGDLLRPNKDISDQ